MINHYSVIEPVDSKERPIWSVVIPTFNCASYLKETLESVLVQYPGPEKMEIIVVDDHSIKDDPGKVVEEFGHGRVKFIRQSTNVGKSKNYEAGLKASRGFYIHLLHGDDTVNNGFYSKIEELFNRFRDAGAAFCQCNYIDANGKIIQQTGIEIPEDGIIPNWIEKIATWQRIQPPSIVFKREVYENVGGYDYRLKYMEDWEFYVRCSLLYRFLFSPEILANYRIFESSSSQQSIISGKRLHIVKDTINIIDSYLPDYVLKSIKKERKKAISSYYSLFLPILVKKKLFIQIIKTYFRIIIIYPNMRYSMRAIKLIFK